MSATHKPIERMGISATWIFNRLLVGAVMAAWLTTSIAPVVAQDVGERKVVTALGIQWADSAKGVQVAEIDPRGPAAALELKPGDILVSVNGREVATGDELTATVAKLAPGDAIRVNFARGTQMLVKTMEMPESRVNMFGATLQAAGQNRIQVGEVSPNTPAEQAGLLKGDIIVSMAGQRPASLADLSAFITRIVEDKDNALQPIEVTVQRAGEPTPQKLVVQRVATPAVPARATPATAVPAPGGLAEAALVLAITVHVQGNQVFVAGVIENGPAAVAGIRTGDRILSVGRKPIDSFEALKTAIRAYRPGDEVAVEVERAGKPGVIRVTAMRAPADVQDVALHAPASAAAAAVVQQRVQVNAPGAPAAEPTDVASLITEVRLLRARVEALEQIVKEIAPQSQPPRKP